MHLVDNFIFLDPRDKRNIINKDLFRETYDNVLGVKIGP